MMAMVHFAITGGEVIPEIEMPMFATILDLKETIEEILDVDVARQTLNFNNQVLTNDQTIGHLNLGPFAALALVVTPLAGQPKFNILVKSINEEINIRVKETTLVVDLKRKLERRCGILFEKITLHRLSKEMEDDFPLSAYYVCEGSEVEMTTKIEPR
ncbi:hypothetical protein KPL71_003270 [Citrus sinensis]|uniref:Uncharacterized protein n=1 Tax=Citrus sinensis TaxID=2711 RepID=A0ACB8MY59_CITSI|nr:hypothetical protein KPL71_003270 [Citrus sinensis]